MTSSTDVLSEVNIDSDTTSRYIEPSLGRGDRLSPKRTNRCYWHLTELRRAYERIVFEQVRDAQIVRLVDLGCGNMPYRRIFAPHVSEYVGCDLEGNDLADCIIRKDGTVDNPDSCCDLVLSSQVLEHVISPVDYLAEANRILQRGGRLILSTHGVWRYHPDPTDNWRWTGEGLRRQVVDAGFEVTHFEGIMSPASAAIQLLQDAVLHRIPRLCRPSFIFLMQYAIQIADYFSSSDVKRNEASVFLLVAEKV